MDNLTRCVVASLLMAMASPCLSREAQVLKFQFEIPDAWQSEGGGLEEARLYATGTTSKEMFAPPNLLVEACDPTKLRDCNDSQWPNPPKDFEAEGCASAVKQVLVLRGGVEETRWVCETIKTSNGPITVGISIYRHQGASMYVAHFSEHGPSEVSRFLDGLSESLTVADESGPIGLRPN